jgi:hypothetical protein
MDRVAQALALLHVVHGALPRAQLQRGESASAKETSAFTAQFLREPRKTNPGVKGAEPGQKIPIRNRNSRSSCHDVEQLETIAAW